MEEEKEEEEEEEKEEEEKEDKEEEEEEEEGEKEESVCPKQADFLSLYTTKTFQTFSRGVPEMIRVKFNQFVLTEDEIYDGFECLMKVWQCNNLSAGMVA